MISIKVFTLVPTWIWGRSKEWKDEKIAEWKKLSGRIAI